MPWVQNARRDKRKQKNMAPYLECAPCSADDNPASGYMPPAMRASWRCGWMMPSERKDPGFRGALPKWGTTPEDLCPGYLLCLPEVEEAMTAYQWWEKGGTLNGLIPPEEQTPLIKECINLIDRVFGEWAEAAQDG